MHLHLCPRHFGKKYQIIPRASTELQDDPHDRWGTSPVGAPHKAGPPTAMRSWGSSLRERVSRIAQRLSWGAAEGAPDFVW
jgi:hypothetical protein